MITVYSLPRCVQCVATKRHLNNLGLAYTEIDLLDVPERAEEFKALGYASAPIVFAADPSVSVDAADEDGLIWSGFSPDRLNALAA